MNKQTAKDYLPLVQALADGKVIQINNGHGLWVDLGENVHFRDFPSEYRIKPEPREIWVNEYADSAFMYKTEDEAKRQAAPGVVRRRYREVLE